MKTITLPWLPEDLNAWPIYPIETRLNGKGFEIKITAMYERPFEINFSSLMKFANYFGTESIDVDNISHRGCETCDYGSKYGYTLQIFGATLNVPTFE
jgi:hypothetical protein